MRFYGGERADVWLMETPSAVVSACIRMLPRLEAEEAMSAIEQAGIGFSGDEGGQRMRQLEGIARGAAERGLEVRKPKDPGLLMRTGWSIRKVKRTKAGVT